MQGKEEKICSFTQNGVRLQLVKVTKEEYDIFVDEISNTVGGYIIRWSDGAKQKIKDEEVEGYAKRWKLHKDNENHYFKLRDSIGPKKITKYEVRLNRKIIKRCISEYEMRKVFATYAQNIVLQLKYEIHELCPA